MWILSLQINRIVPYRWKVDVANDDDSMISFFPFRLTEIVRAFTQVINDNLCFYWGTSRWSPMEIMEAYSVARQFNLIPPTSEQAEYHLFQREKVEVLLPDVSQKIGRRSIRKEQ